jgi:translation initiation factor 1 (eIF-1/SUI1)
MMRFATSCLVALTVAMAACSSDDKGSASRQSDLGTGINTVDRKYVKSASDTWDAATSAVKSYDFTIESDKHDSMGGELKARRANGEKVVVRVRSLDEKNSDVSVRVDPGNRNMAEMIHERIADKVGLKEAKSAFFGGNSCEGTYPKSLDACVKAAEDAAKRLNLTVTNREMKDGAAIVDARESNSNPVQFKMKKVDEGTKVTFIAGREKTDATRDLASRMKAEFESCCTAKGN